MTAQELLNDIRSIEKQHFNKAFSKAEMVQHCRDLLMEHQHVLFERLEQLKAAGRINDFETMRRRGHVEEHIAHLEGDKIMPAYFADTVESFLDLKSSSSGTYASAPTVSREPSQPGEAAKVILKGFAFATLVVGLLVAFGQFLVAAESDFGIGYLSAVGTLIATAFSFAVLYGFASIIELLQSIDRKVAREEKTVAAA